VGEAGEPTARPSPSNGNTNIYRYHQVPLEGKRFILVVVAVYGYLLPSAKQFASWRPGEFSTASKLIRIGFVWGVVILIIALALTLTIVLAFVGIALGIIGGILFLIGKVGIIILFFKLRDAFNSTLFLVVAILAIIGMFIPILDFIAWILVLVGSSSIKSRILSEAIQV